MTNIIWLIERGQSVRQFPTIWWGGGNTRTGENYKTHWTEDVNKARTFSSKESAETLCSALFGKSAIVTEHVWLSTQHAPAAPVAESAGLHTAALEDLARRAICSIGSFDRGLQSHYQKQLDAALRARSEGGE